MQPGIYVVGSELAGFFGALDPGRLASSHPVWAADVERFSPWEETRISAKRPGAKEMAAWRAGRGQTDNAILVCGRCTSTMDGLRELIDVAGMRHWDCLAAVEQEKGRGQMQRTWISPPGNIYVSWYWPDPSAFSGAAPQWRSLASLLAGYLVAAVLESFGAEVRIKWPNDLLVGDRKVCGILVEHRGGRLIAGIGVNAVSAPAREQLLDAFAVPAASLSEMGVSLTPLQFLTRLCETGRSRMENLVHSLEPESFVGLVEQRLAWMDREVTIRKSGQEAFCAEIRGLAPDGGLVIRRNGKTQVIYSGSVLSAENIRLS